MSCMTNTIYASFSLLSLSQDDPITFTSEIPINNCEWFKHLQLLSIFLFVSLHPGRGHLTGFVKIALEMVFITVFATHGFWVYCEPTFISTDHCHAT